MYLIVGGGRLWFFEKFTTVKQLLPPLLFMILNEGNILTPPQPTVYILAKTA